MSGVSMERTMFKSIKANWNENYGNDPILEVEVDFNTYAQTRNEIYEAVAHDNGYIARCTTDGIVTYGYYRDAEPGQLFTRRGKYNVKMYMQGGDGEAVERTFNSWSSSRAEIINAAFQVGDSDLDNYLSNVRAVGDRTFLGDITIGKLAVLAPMLPDGLHMLLVRDNSIRKEFPGQLDVIPSLSPTEIVYPDFKAWKHEEHRERFEVISSL